MKVDEHDKAFMQTRMTKIKLNYYFLIKKYVYDYDNRCNKTQISNFRIQLLQSNVAIIKHK